MTNEKLPNLKLVDRELPYQKITISRMPISLYKELDERAQKFSQSVSIYCRIVLEHAMDERYRHDYIGIIENSYSLSDGVYPFAVTIPLLNKKFLNEIRLWDPFGAKANNRIALSILKKHIDTRDW